MRDAAERRGHRYGRGERTGPRYDRRAALTRRALWWLWCGECTRCGQWWLVAQEERQNDVFCLRRLSEDEATALVEDNIWPSDFDSYEALLRLGLDAGKSVRFAEPEEANSLRWTITDLAKARPGIRVSELAELLNLDIDTAHALARRAVRDDGAVIELDRDGGTQPGLTND